MPDFAVREVTADIRFTGLTWQETVFQKTMTALPKILIVRHADPLHFEHAAGSLHRDGPGSE
jgi:hypothetical protein